VTNATEHGAGTQAHARLPASEPQGQLGGSGLAFLFLRASVGETAGPGLLSIKKNQKTTKTRFFFFFFEHASLTTKTAPTGLRFKSERPCQKRRKM
jgi:hypothetical protein